MRRNKPLALVPTLLGIAALLCTTAPAFADGKFFRRLEVADEPGIQAQRAVVAFKDGIETLIVQSDLVGQGDSFGWLLPLPAAPTRIAPCAPYTLTALAKIVRPEMAEFSATTFIFCLVLMVSVVAACLNHLHVKSTGKDRGAPLRMLLTIVIPIFLAAFLLPTLSSERKLDDDVNVLQSTQAGIYDVSVIQSPSAEAVADWLKTNGFAAPPSATAAIQDYVSRHWCFLAAKVSAKPGETVTHHPLKITFPTREAVYPMKLTGSDGQPVQLDLFVIAKDRAGATGLRTWVSGTFVENEGSQTFFSEFECNVPPVYKSDGLHFAHLGIPAVTEMMWPGCVLTRLHGRLEPDAMTQDLTLSWGAPVSQQTTLHSSGDALGRSAAFAMLIVTLLFLPLTWIAVRSGWTWRELLRRRLGVVLLPALLISGAEYAALETVRVKSAPPPDVRNPIPLYVHLTVLEELGTHPPAGLFPEGYRKLLLAKQPDTLVDPAEQLERVGDYQIEPAENGWKLTIIDGSFIPVTISIDQAGQPRRT